MSCDHAVLNIDSHGNFIAKPLHSFKQKLGVCYGRGADNNAHNSQIKVLLHRRYIADTAAKLNLQSAVGDNFSDYVKVPCAAILGPVKVDQM